MIRRGFNLLSLLSLLLLAAVLALWVRGYREADHFWLVYGDDGAELLRSARGRLSVRHVAPNDRGMPVPRRVSHWSCPPGSQLPPRPSPLHWEWAFLAYEGTPRPTRQELAAARVALQKINAARPDELELRRRLSAIPPRQGMSDVELFEQYMRIRRASLELDRRRFQRDNLENVVTGTHYHEWTFPAWLAAVALSVLPGISLALRRRRRILLRRGLCPECGYDLRATPGRCPECGSIPGAPALEAQPV